METQITEVQIIPIKPRDGLVAFASIVLNGQLYLGSIGVYKKLHEEGYRITYPTRQIGQKGLQVFFPIRKKLSASIEQAILTKAEEVFEKSNLSANHSI